MTKTAEQNNQLCKHSHTAISESKQSKEELATMIYDTANTMKLYGKQPEAMGSYTRVFITSLEDYDIMEVRNAFKHYWKVGTGMPEPRDIINIIEKAGLQALRQESLVDWKEEAKRREEAYGAN